MSVYRIKCFLYINKTHIHSFMFTFIDITYRIKNKNMVSSSLLRLKANLLSCNKTFILKPLNKSPIHYYIPRIRRIGGCYGFTSKPPAARRPPPVARHPPPAARNGVNAITQNTTGWIVLKFGIHIGSDSVLIWLTFQGRRSKVKVTASENDVIFSTFLNFHFLSHFPPKPSWGGHSNTPPAIVPPCHSFVRPSVRPFVRQ